MGSIPITIDHRMVHHDPLADYIDAASRPDTQQDAVVQSSCAVAYAEAEAICDKVAPDPEHEPQWFITRSPSATYKTTNGAEGEVWVQFGWGHDGHEPEWQADLLCRAGGRETALIMGLGRHSLRAITPAGERAGTLADLNFLRGIIGRIQAGRRTGNRVLEDELARRKRG